MRYMIKRGATTSEIAVDLFISENSARKYKKIEEGQSILIFFKKILSDNNAVSLSGIPSHINDHGIVRSLSSIPVERNSLANIDCRKNYCWMIACISDDRIIFVDETGINLHINLDFGYSPSGLTPRISVPDDKGINIYYCRVLSAHETIRRHGIRSY
ncbi:hypothetical protein RF11_06929 [Thelohanellus kitauei]|uniref:Uncharacterized protein n=1 Tax=Thelohanellus kitauei TaxID=669202 RepID=A0A0C2MMN5_THEKT|nr:hypothetical protein RF11_06929 [Thelohanellus kitauei]